MLSIRLHRIQRWLMVAIQSLHVAAANRVQSLRADTANATESLRGGTYHLPWAKYRYQILDDAREKSTIYYAQARRRPWVTAAFATFILLILLVLASGPSTPATLYKPFLAFDDGSCDHPVFRIAMEAQKSFNATLEKQSQSLDEAIAEYQRRYRMPPPPHFDKWYEFARERKVVLIDEYDGIYHALLPFWGVSPSVIRARTRQDLGFANVMMGVSVRNGRAIHLFDGQGEYQQSATMAILEKFSQWLPDMDLAFNVHDEPRVVVPHEELQRMVSSGREAHGRLARNVSLINEFSRSKDVVDPIPEVTTSRYNNIERQETWLASRLSCPPDSPARSLDGDAPDDTASYAVEPLGFVWNQTAFSDICKNPSLRHRLGVFERPNAFKITSELSAVFSMSRPSSFQDIVVPSPWYHQDVTAFDEGHSVAWEDKIHDLYWRGGDSGGHSRGGSWRNLIRQRVIGNLTHPTSPRYILRPKNETSLASCTFGGKGNGWEAHKVRATNSSRLFNTKFTRFENCDDDCFEATEFLGEAERDSQDEAWKHRYLLDMDGHAYSGRFYAFMRSKSLPMKLSLFREWHESVLIPWVHYVPLSKDTNEYTELLRYFEEDVSGRNMSKSIAQEGRDWAYKAVRNEDMEVYMFRLFLEFARVQDDNRESLGYHIDPSQPSPDIWEP
ncbi:hypothetical protein NUU61_009114 [Penicillium alfredii]|uniref:Glycosyl transferase CAP10 domain-containing protein n=1 Tax=Penicillium alfredii TaxID=1506179 RepID=A0A9W9EML9_9EURO|nr:uncharacterized protein NUU61_009114 [Penicillium alfredii]KAJ5084535.1 hypothetical protein NUU61_009114 [Penicillium alfredii]